MKTKRLVAWGLLAFIFSQPLLIAIPSTPLEPINDTKTVKASTQSIYISNDYYSYEIVEDIEVIEEKPVFNGFDVPLSIDVQEQIIDICEAYGYEPELLLAIAMVETSCDEMAIGDNGQSIGMYQIQPRWWKTTRNLHDAVDSTYVACDVLNVLYEKYGDTTLVLNAYNLGNPNKYNGYSWKVLEKYRELKGE